MTLLYQCDLSSGATKTRAYIPQKGAVVGSVLSLKDSDDPDRRWTVESVADKGIEESYLNELKVAYRKQREASDI